MTLAQKQKETKPTTPPVPLPSTPTEAQQKVAKLRERQLEQETVEAKKATEAQQKVVKLREQQAQQEVAEQRVASLRAEEAEKQAAQQRIAALRARVGSSGAGEGNGSAGGSGPGSGTAGTGRGSGAPGGGRGTGNAGAGGTGSGGLSGIRLRNYQAELQEKIKDAWKIPSRSKGLEATFFLSINRAGQVEQARLVRGSGNTLFDESLQLAIKKAQPLPALPEDFTDRTLEVTLPFRDTAQ
jgi:TolA protein